MNAGKWALWLVASAALPVLSGCTTTAAKKALNKPMAEDPYAGFDPEAAEASRRKAEKVDRVKEETDPEEAVDLLVKHLQKERPYAIPAEEQLKLWGSKQGVDKIVVRKVRPLLKHPQVEVRAPALRLTMLFGGNDSNGDLIECLADTEYGIRAAAIRSLKARTHMDFGFSPTAGEVARAKSVDEWRQWYQADQRKTSIQPPSVYEANQPSQPTVVSPDGARKAESLKDSETEMDSRPAKPAKKDGKTEKKQASKATSGENQEREY